MGYFPNIDPVYLYQRKGTTDDPYIPRKEEKVVYANTNKEGIPSYYATLGEIPDFKTKVKVVGSNGILYKETTNDTFSSNEYRVDYTTGIVYFNGSNNEKLFRFDYLGTGYVSFPSSRIIMDDGEMSLQEFIRTVKTMKTKWYSPVANFASISAAIPSPASGDTIQTLNDGKIYRYENGAWIHSQVNTDSAIADMQNKLATSLEDIDAGTFTDEDDGDVLDGGAF